MSIDCEAGSAGETFGRTPWHGRETVPQQSECRGAAKRAFPRRAWERVAPLRGWKDNLVAIFNPGAEGRPRDPGCIPRPLRGVGTCLRFFGQRGGVVDLHCAAIVDNELIGVGADS